MVSSLAFFSSLTNLVACLTQDYQPFSVEVVFLILPWIHLIGSNLQQVSIGQKIWNTLVVYYLHGQTSCFTIWANGTQNSGLVNFIPEYYCVYHLFRLLKKWLQRPKTGIKDGFKELEHEIPYETFQLRKQDYLFTCSISSKNFPLEPPKKLCSILLSNWIFW